MAEALSASAPDGICGCAEADAHARRATHDRLRLELVSYARPQWVAMAMAWKVSVEWGRTSDELAEKLVRRAERVAHVGRALMAAQTDLVDMVVCCTPRAVVTG